MKWYLAFFVGAAFCSVYAQSDYLALQVSAKSNRASGKPISNLDKGEGYYSLYYFVQLGSTLNYNLYGGDGETWNITNVSGYALIHGHLISVRHSIGSGHYEDVSDLHYSEWGVLYGRAFQSRLFFVSASVGIGRTTGTYVIGSDQRGAYKNAFGVPFELQAICTPVPYLGIGVKFTSTSPRHAPGRDFMVTLQIGKIGFREP